MSKSNRQKRKSTKSSTQTPQKSWRFANLPFLFQGLVAALLVVRLLIPPETSVQGDTLWLVQLWLLAGLGWSLIAAQFVRKSASSTVQLDRFDLFLGLIIIGHFIASYTVFAGGGDRRAVVNMVWEWISLGVTFFLIRRLFPTTLIKQRLLLAMVSTAVVLAGYGIWQQHVIYPENIRFYEQLTTEKSGIELQQELQSIGVPADRVGRINWVNRLHSTEPTATFGLANSFAGLLAALFVLLLIWGIRCWKNEPLFIGMLTITVTVMGYCLILTKSRTAWVGTLAGLCLYGVLQWGGKSVKSKKWLLRTGVGLAVVVAAFIVAGLSGGIDREVFSEAPKSLLYRMQYWEGSWGVVKEHPLLGVGAGNFRSYYLQHKLAESSESIADPHNLFFDIWTSGGLLAVAGLIGILFFTAKLLFSSHVQSGNLPDNGNLSDSGNQNRKYDSVFVGTAGGFLFYILLRWVLFVEFDLILVTMFAGWVMVYGGLSRFLMTAIISTQQILCAAVVLVVHLLAAGGMERPAMVQTMLLLLAVAISVPQRTTETASSSHHEKNDRKNNADNRQLRSLIPVLMFWTVLFLCCLMTATLPVMKHQIALNKVATIKDVDLKKRYLTVASQVDPLTTSSTFQLAQISMSQWNRPIKEQNYFQDAINLISVVLEKEPRKAGLWRTLGTWYLLAYQESHAPEDLQSAVNAFSEAVRLHPTSVFFRKDYALALQQANKMRAADVEATEALRLEEINRKYHHSDKYLSAEEAEQLKSIVKNH